MCILSENSNYIQQQILQSQISCPYTPEQNGFTEQENKHLLEVTRDLLQMNVPKMFLIEAMLKRFSLSEQTHTQYIHARAHTLVYDFCCCIPISYLIFLIVLNILVTDQKKIISLIESLLFIFISEAQCQGTSEAPIYQKCPQKPETTGKNKVVLPILTACLKFWCTIFYGTMLDLLNLN